MPSHHIVESLSIASALHYRDMTIDFVNGLVCLIGGRGAGKSGILHLICFALGVPVPEEYADKVHEHLEATLGAGRVSVWVRTEHGVRYNSTRSLGSDPVIRGEDGELADVSLDGELFKVNIYRQGEIEGIARIPSAQLALIDRFAEADIRRIEDAVQDVQQKLAHNDETRRRLEADIADDAAREGELGSVIEALKGIDLGGDAAASAKTATPEQTKAALEERTRAHEAKVLRGRERAAMAALAGELKSVRADLDGFARQALAKLARAVEGDLERGPHADVFQRAHAAMQRVAGVLEEGAGRLRAEIGLADAVAADEGRVLGAAHATEDAAYQALVVRDDADRKRAAESERLHQRFAQLSTIAKRLADRRRELGATRAAATALFAEQTRLLGEKSARRKQVALELSEAFKGEIEVTISASADARGYAELLADILQGANIRPASFLTTIAERIPPSVLVALAERNELEPLMEIDPVKGTKEERASKILALLRASGRLFELEMVRLEDAPLIQLKVGKKLRPSARLSVGQRCSCILPLVLLRKSAVLMIDQAEDSLDNAFIYQVLVQRIVEAKKNRQLFLVTHNPNPPTLANAERIVVLSVDEEGHGALDAAGTFAEVRESVQRLLEGGAEAFLERGRRYGHYAGDEAAEGDEEAKDEEEAKADGEEETDGEEGE